MPRKISKTRGLKVGDLVYHLLYGKEWVGVILEIIDVYKEEQKFPANDEMALIKMQPGTKYEYFFKSMVSKKNRITSSTGLVITNWLFRLEETNEKREN